MYGKGESSRFGKYTVRERRKQQIWKIHTYKKSLLIIPSGTTVSLLRKQNDIFWFSSTSFVNNNLSRQTSITYHQCTAEIHWDVHAYWLQSNNLVSSWTSWSTNKSDVGFLQRWFPKHSPSSYWWEFFWAAHRYRNTIVKETLCRKRERYNIYIRHTIPLV